MRTSQVLEKALDLLGPNGEHWCKGQYYDGDKACMQGATRLATPTTEVFHAGRCTNLFLEVLPPSEGNPIARWNDAPERTWPEVKAAFEKAILLAKQSEAGG